MAQLIVALDVPSRDSALAIAQELKDAAPEWTPWCKVGMELYTACGPGLLEALKKLGYKIFLDLKFYDIPNTVAQAVIAAISVGADMLTLHCQGGERMCLAARGAVEASACEFAGDKPLLFGVTALTSFELGEMPGISMTPSAFAVKLSVRAAERGLDGVVCSGFEVEKIKKHSPDLLCLCPGIRPAGTGADDQRRVMTPAKANSLGADYLVVGRPILKALDRAATMLSIYQESV